jgi:hypothetical protein
MSGASLTPKLQVTGSAGVTFNFENTEPTTRAAMNFTSNAHLGASLQLGLSSALLVTTCWFYDCRQLTGDPGAGAALAPSRGRITAIGLSVSYKNSMPKNRWQGDAIIMSARLRW